MEWRNFKKFVVDSRKVEPGCCFFALKGERVDGHDFLDDVAKKGARLAVTCRGVTASLPTLEVDDPFETLQAWAKQKFALSKAKKIGVTGSLGKTTTKDFLAQLLSTRFRVSKTIESYNGQIGLPLSILNSDPEAEILVLEMGINQIGEMERLIDIAPIELAVMTGISESHVGNFGSMEELERQKKLIFSSPNLERSFTRDDALEICRPLTASHLNDNLALASAVAHSLGMSEREIEKASQNLTLAPHRFNQLEKDGVIYIDDSYNASATSIKAAAQNLPKGKRYIAVLSEMVEMGAFHDEEHRKAGMAIKGKVDELFVFGDRVESMIDGFGGPSQHFKDFDALKNTLALSVKPGDVVLIKGSNSKRLWRLIEH